MANIIKIKRGLSKNLSQANLQEGEMAFTTDTKKLYISNTDEPINNNTTYSLSKSGSTITLTGSDGSKTSVTDADTNTTYNAATTSANGLMTSAMVTKLNGITEGANKYSLPTASASTLGGVKVGTNLTISSGVLSAKDTTYSAATTSAAGLMSAADKTKLDGIAEGANKYTYTLPTASSTLGGVKTTSTVTSTSGLTACPIISGVPYYKDTNTTYTLPNATSSVLGGVKIGSNITISSGTISLTKDNVTTALGYTPPTTNTTYSNMTAATSSAAGKAGLVPAPAAGKQASFLRGDGTWVVPTNTTYSAATTNAAGLMSATDKSKLDGIAASANNYSLPAATTSARGGVIVGSNITVSSGTISLTKANVTSALGYTPPTTNTTYSVVSTSANGLCPKRGGTTTKFLRDDGTWAVPPDTNTTYSAATTSANGLMSSSDKTKLNGIATGAQVNNVVVSTSTPTASTTQVWINPNGQSALDAVSVIGEYAEYRLTSHQSVSQSANWGDIFVPFSTGTFTTSNSSMFSASGNGIKCNFTGRIMVIANIGTGQTGKELDLEVYNSNGSPSQRATININQGTVNSTHIFEVNSGAVITAGFNSNSLSFTIYKDSTLILVRIK